MTRTLPVVDDHISFSRLKRYAQCPRSYALHYVEKAPSAPNDALKLGSILHAALEWTYKQIVAERLQGRFPTELLVLAYRRAWTRTSLSDFVAFDDGLRILKAYAAAHPRIDFTMVLAIEQEFRLLIGRWEVLGYIDRVDRIDDETIDVVDYKSNRILFTQEEVDTDLQLSIYAMAAMALWPWARVVRLRFHMLRHGITIETSRTKEQLERTREYIIALATEIEEATEFPARLQANCIYCDHTAGCDEYARALKAERREIATSDDDLAALGRERKELSAVLKVLGHRKDQIDKLLKAHLDTCDALVLDGVGYRLLQIPKVTYPVRRTLELLSAAIGLQPIDIADSVAVIENSELKDVLRELEAKVPRDEHTLLRAELEAIAERHVSQRLIAKEVH